MVMGQTCNRSVKTHSRHLLGRSCQSLLYPILLLCKSSLVDIVCQSVRSETVFDCIVNISLHCTRKECRVGQRSIGPAKHAKLHRSFHILWTLEISCPSQPSAPMDVNQALGIRGTVCNQLACSLVCSASDDAMAHGQPPLLC